MWDIVWLDSAVEDLIKLKGFLSQKNMQAARKAAEAIIKATSDLASFPLAGKAVTDLPDYRDLPIRFGAAGYVIRYRVVDVVYIVHIRHYREDNILEIS